MTAQARAFIEAEQAGSGNVVKACELLDVSRSAYYHWRQHTPSAREVSDRKLIERVEDIHRESKGTYGAPRSTPSWSRQACMWERNGWLG